MEESALGYTAVKGRLALSELAPASSGVDFGIVLGPLQFCDGASQLSMFTAEHPPGGRDLAPECPSSKRNLAFHHGRLSGRP